VNRDREESEETNESAAQLPTEAFCCHALRLSSAQAAARAFGVAWVRDLRRALRWTTVSEGSRAIPYDRPELIGDGEE
jgi:hypothetical protein